MKKNIILVTHDPKIACRSEKVFFIEDGVITTILQKCDGDSLVFYRKILGQMEKMEE